MPDAYSGKIMLQAKYTSAMTAERVVVTIADVEANPALQATLLKCLGCGTELIPKLGLVRQHHFAHKPDAICKPETYLHKLAKTLFYQEYARCLAEGTSFVIGWHVETRCIHGNGWWKCRRGSERTQDLTDHFTHVELEAQDGQFRPDVLLWNPETNKKLWVEIYVTHGISEEKQEPGTPIIELYVQGEEDLEGIRQHAIRKDDLPISWAYNFKGTEIRKALCNGKCPHR